MLVLVILVALSKSCLVLSTTSFHRQVSRLSADQQQPHTHSNIRLNPATQRNANQLTVNSANVQVAVDATKLATFNHSMLNKSVIPGAEMTGLVDFTGGGGDFEDGQSASTTANNSLNNYSSLDYYLDQEHLEQLRNQIKLLASQAYRYERICYAFAYGVIIVLSFFGNLLVCKVCFRNMTKTNALIMSLAASDLLMTVFNIPFNFFRISNFSWPFGSAMCFVVNFVQHLVVYISSYTMAIIAIQRYRSVCGIRFDYDACKVPADTVTVNSKECKLSSNTLVNQVRSLCAPLSLPFAKMWSCCSQKRLCGFKDNDAFSMRAIFITICITWIASAFISVVFTFSSTVVVRRDVFEVILNEMYNSNLRDNNESVTADNDDLFASSQGHYTSDYVLRCQNPVPKSVENFSERFSIKVDFAKSVLIFITQYFIPLTISCCLYIRIGKIISRQGKLTSLRGNLKARIQQKKKRRRIIMLVLVVAVFAICWLPIHAFHIFIDAGIFNFNYQVFMVVHWLAMSSVSYNPFIYCWLNKNFRKAALRVFCCCCVDSETKLTNHVARDGQHRGGSGCSHEKTTKNRVMRLKQISLFGRGSRCKHGDQTFCHKKHINAVSNLTLPPQDFCGDQPCSEQHKTSNISVMTETSVVPFSNNNLDEITSIAEVSIEKSDFDDEQEQFVLQKKLKPKNKLKAARFFIGHKAKRPNIFKPNCNYSEQGEPKLCCPISNQDVLVSSDSAICLRQQLAEGNINDILIQKTSLNCLQYSQTGHPEMIEDDAVEEYDDDDAILNDNEELGFQNSRKVASAKSNKGIQNIELKEVVPNVVSSGGEDGAWNNSEHRGDNGNGIMMGQLVMNLNQQCSANNNSGQCRYGSGGTGHLSMLSGSNSKHQSGTTPIPTSTMTCHNVNVTQPDKDNNNNQANNNGNRSTVKLFLTTDL